MEGVREKVRQKASFRIAHAGNIGNQTQSHTVSDASHNGIQADGPEFIHKRLRANPVIPQKHHGFLSQLMSQIHQLLYQSRNLPALKSHKVLVFPGGDPVLIVVIALINNILRPEGISRLLLKLLQNIGRDGRGIAVPIHIFFPLQLVKNQSKLMKKGCIADHIHIRVLLHKPFQPFQSVSMSLGLPYVKGDLVLKILPFINHRVVHMHRIPD